MTIKTATATIMSTPDATLDDEARKVIEDAIGKTLDQQGLDPEAKAEALQRLKQLFTGSGTVEGLSAASIAKSLEVTAEGLENVARGIVALGYSLNRRGKGRQCYEMGEASGMLSACRALMSSAADRVLHAVACECHTDEPESEAETIPPPAPEASA